MSNTLGVYNPYFYANEALIHLRKNLGMAARVHRGFEAERNSFGLGEYINIRTPSTFTAASAPSSAVDLATKTTQIQLDSWKEVKFALTDKELAFTGQRIINDHIAPAAYALADDIDQALAGLYVDIPWYYDIADTTAVADVTGPRKVMVDNKVPMQPGRIHAMISPAFEKGLLDLSAFSQHQGAGPTGVSSQLSGHVGTRYGLEFFTNQNTQLHTAGACADTAGAILAGGFSAGDTEITIDDLTDTQTVKAGDSFVIAGNDQRYVFTEDGTVASNALTEIEIYPALVADAAAEAVVTIRADSHRANLYFHRNAFALAMAPLPMMAEELGARVATVSDPVTGLSVRARIYYIGNSSVVHVALDCLYGVKTLDPNLAVRACGNATTG